MWLVLCASNDLPALWAHQGLKARGLAPLELVTAEALALSMQWEHRLGAEGVSIHVTLGDGRRIRNDTTRGVLNRLLSVSPDHLLLIHPSDHEYVTHELTAFFLSWLHALPLPVLNRPTPQGLSGQWRHVSEWVWLARQAGLPTPHYTSSVQDHSDEMGVKRRLVPFGTPVNTVFVVNGHVVGASAPPEIQTGCRRLAALSGTCLLGVEFAAGPGDAWTFAGATPLPDLRLGGEALLDVLASVLKGQTGEK